MTSEPVLAPSALSPFSLRYLAFASGTGLSSLGEAAWVIAFTVALTELGDASTAGAVLAIAGIPRVVAMLGGGVLADARGPRWVMMRTDAARSILMASAAAAILIWDPTVVLLTIVASMLAFLGALFVPAPGALRPRLLADEHLVRGNALYLIGLRSGQAAGGPVGAAVLSIGGLAAVAMTNAIGFLIATFTVKWCAPRSIDPIGNRSAPDDHRYSAIARVNEGLRVVWADRQLTMLLVVVGLVELSLSGPLNLGLVLISTELLGSSALGAGLLLSAFTVGATATFLLNLMFPVGRRAGAIAGTAMFGVAVSLSAVGQTSTIGVTSGAFGLIGILSALQGLVLTSLVQRASPEFARARVMSIMLLLVFGSVPLGSLLIGLLVDWFGVPAALMVHGVIALLAAGLFLGHSEMRRASLV